MSPEEMKRIVRRIPLAVFNQRKLAVIDEVVAPTVVEHAAPPGTAPDLDAMKSAVLEALGAFADLHYTLDAEVAEGDRVAQYVTAEGTMTGPFQGFAPTGRHATWNEIHITRFAGNMIVEHWANIDQMGMMQQLGLMPTQAI